MSEAVSLRILVADDEPIMREYFGEVLTEMGHEVVATAANGAELIERCRETKPDLIIADIRMPDTDGIEAAERIAAFHEAPIILVSALHDPDLIARAERTTVLAYLVKPIKRPSLETAIAIARTRFEQIRALKDEAGDLRQALEDRKVIERAKGVLAKRMGLNEEQAFGRLRTVAMEERKKIVEVARVIVRMDQE